MDAGLVVGAGSLADADSFVGAGSRAGAGFFGGRPDTVQRFRKDRLT